MAPVGAEVTISPYEWKGEGPPPSNGDCLMTATGRIYLVLKAKPSKADPNRLALRCLVVERPFGDSACYSLVWNARKPHGWRWPLNAPSRLKALTA